MYALSTKFLAALRQSHTISVAAYLYRPSAPTTPISTQILGGSFIGDIDARVRRQATLDIAFSLSDPVTAEIIQELPFGGYCAIERGIRFADGTIERVRLGYFRVENVNWDELQGLASLTLADRMAQVADESFTTPFVPSGLKPSDAIVQIVQQVFGATIYYDVTTTPAVEPTLVDVVYDEDRAAAVSDLAAGISAEAFFNNMGEFVLRPRPYDPPSLPPSVWTLDTGASGVMISASETLDRSHVRNGVAVRATPDPTLPPIYSLVTDNDLASPTRWGGPFGRVPLIVNSNSIMTQAQADATADNLLRLRLGLSRTLELRGVPNPALEPGDAITVVHSDGRSELQIVNALEIGLDPGGEMRLTTKANWRPQPLGTPTRTHVYRGTEALLELER
jgi:Domain of unknown function (DUF5047)